MRARQSSRQVLNIKKKNVPRLLIGGIHFWKRIIEENFKIKEKIIALHRHAPRKNISKDSEI